MAARAGHSARREGDRIVAIVVPGDLLSAADPTTAIEIPAVTKARLGLDAQRSWIICRTRPTWSPACTRTGARRLA